MIRIFNKRSKLVILPLLMPVFAYSNTCEIWYGTSFESSPVASFETALNKQCAAIVEHLAGQERFGCNYDVLSCEAGERTYVYGDPLRPRHDVLAEHTKVCHGTVYPNVTTKRSIWAIPCRYKVGMPEEIPAPDSCVGNPVNIVAGKKYQKEEDVPALGQGLLQFIRYYNQAKPSLWEHNYQRALTLIDHKNPGSGLKLSADYGPNKQNVCTSGWTQLRNNTFIPWAAGTVSTPSADGYRCDITKNGKTLHSLPLISNQLNVIVGHTPELIRLDRPQSSIVFQKINNVWKSVGTDQGQLDRVSDGQIAWRYQKEQLVEEYSVEGRLLSIRTANAARQDLAYDLSGNLIQVADSAGRSLVFGYTDGKLSSLTVDGSQQFTYSYNAAGILSSVQRPDQTQRIYHYEDARFPTYLTGITDERGVRYATWAYDGQGRAISSEHADGTDKTLLGFNADGSTTVTNPLGKQTTYHFGDIAGARRVTQVEGHATTSCEGANQNYTYTPEGWLASKTDWKGNTTTFSYNTLGQEISRTEAFGTPDARTITTEWHPDFYVKTRVVEGGKETLYTYDDNGRVLGAIVNLLQSQ